MLQDLIFIIGMVLEKVDADLAVAAAAIFDQALLGTQSYQERLAEFTTPVQYTKC